MPFTNCILFVEISLPKLSVVSFIVFVVIGNKGRQITYIQTEAKCRVQMSPANGEGSDGMRRCTLQGSRSAILKAKTLIENVHDSSLLSGSTVPSMFLKKLFGPLRACYRLLHEQISNHQQILERLTLEKVLQTD